MPRKVYKYRCGKSSCRQIVRLTKPIEEFKKLKLCGCGGTLHLYKVPKFRNKKHLCNCDGWPFPHRKGSAPWCKYSTRLPTEEELKSRYGG